MIISVTGHRPDAFLISHYSLGVVKTIANDTACILKREFDADLQFNLGGAIGSDQWMGNACIEHNIKFNLYLPFAPEVFTAYWTEEQKQELSRQMQHAASINIIDPVGSYNVAKYQERNEKMIADSNFTVAFWVGKRRGGTYNSIYYALKQSKFVFNALNELKPIFKENLKKGWTPNVLGG
jgi:uncharacterized phage-like protein YoqJ